MHTTREVRCQLVFGQGEKGECTPPFFLAGSESVVSTSERVVFTAAIVMGVAVIGFHL
jgi:hypothetical protein